MSGPWARYAPANGSAAGQPHTASPELGQEQTSPGTELPSSVDDPGRGPAHERPAPDAAPPGPSRARRGSLIIAVVVLIAIVVASIAILSNPSAVGNAGSPTGPPAATSGSTGTAPAPATRPTVASIGPAAASAAAAGVPRSGTTTRIAGGPAATAVPGAANRAALSWVDAVNEQRVGTARALSCAAVRIKITASFVATVAGSIKVLSIVRNPKAGTATLTFSYRKTTDIARQHDHLSVITEAGRWKICT